MTKRAATTAPEGARADENLTEPSARPVFGDRYAIESEIGHGGMGTVFRARDLKLHREVAVKVLAQGSAADAHQRARFEQEALAAGALNHPNILAVYDVGEHAGQPYIVSELLAGETLRGLLSSGPIAPDGVLDLAVQLASGLATAHRKGIVHRDLKPDNLFVTEDGRLKILDFGIAKLLPATTEKGLRTDTGAVVGTPAYMSPEQVRSRPADARSDVFTYGAVVHEMLSGRPPFQHATTVETAYAILHDPPVTLPASPLTRVIARCLEKDPQARYANAGELLEDVRAIAEGPRHAARKRLRRRTAIVAGLGLIATLALALAHRLGTAARSTNRLRIAVADFVNETDDKDLTGLSGMMITSLGQSNHLSVLTRGTMYDLLGQAGKQAERIDEPLARELAKRTALDGLVLASIRRFGEVYAIDAKVLDPGRNEYLVVAKEQARGKEEVPALIDRVCERLRVGLNEAAHDVRARSAPVARATTGNLEAYRHFFAGDALARRWNLPGARDEYRAAIALDPDFALAYLQLWKANDWWVPIAEANAALLKALALAERLAPSELCTTRAAEALYRHRPEDALAQQLKCAASYPDDLEAVRLAADFAFHSGDSDTAERLFLKARPADTTDRMTDHHLFGIWWKRGDGARLRAEFSERVEKTHSAEAYLFLAWTYAGFGPAEAVERTLEELVRRYPDERSHCALRIVVPVFAAEPEKAEAVAATKCPDWRNTVDAARGRYARTIAALNDSVAAAVARGDKTAAVQDLWYKARLASLRGDTGAWREAIASALAFGAPGEQLIRLYVMAGDVDALKRLRDTHEVPRAWEWDFDASPQLAHGRAEGRADAQIAAHERIARLSGTFDLDLARLYLLQGEPRRVISTLRWIAGTRPPLIGLSSDGWVRILKIPHGLHDLGAAYEQVGDKTRARDAYARLLRLWSDADPDLPDLVDAKARYAALNR